MVEFNKILRNYIVENSIGSFKGNGEGTARILVKGIPFDIAKDFVGFIVEEGGLEIQKRKIPVLLIDDIIESWKEPDSELGGICGKDHLLNFRNSNKVNEFIVLLGEGSSLDNSNTTSLIPIGIDEEIQDDHWAEHDMVQFFLKKSFEGGSLDYYRPERKAVVINILGNFSQGNSHKGDHLAQWQLLREIAKISKYGSLDDIKALLGLIKEEEPNTMDFNRSESIFSKIAYNIENQGVIEAFNDWSKRSSSAEIKEAINGFRKHFTSVYDSASSFKSSPFFYYSSLQWDEDNRDWWHALTIEHWKDILEETEDLDGACKVEVVNSLFQNNKSIPVVKKEIKFKVSHKNKFKIGDSLDIYYKKRKYEEIGSKKILNPDFAEWECEPDFHKNPVFYQFKVDGFKDTTQKVISLYHYEPGFVFDIAQIEKFSALREEKTKGKQKRIWKTNLVLSNSGSHELNFFWDDNRFDFIGGSYKEIESNNKKELEVDIGKGEGSAIFEINDDCEISIFLENKDDKSENHIKLVISTNESEPEGVFNVYDKLVLQNRSVKGLYEKSIVNPTWNILHQIQKWIIDNVDKSYYPIMIGKDFKKNFKKPDWEGKALISSSEINLDCRPNSQQFSPPKELQRLRKEIIEEVTKQSRSSSRLAQPLIEYCEMFALETRKNFSQTIVRYLEEYKKWLDLDHNNASWFEVIAINDVNNNVLDKDPFAILLTPFHPVRLAWQYQSQIILYKSLEEKIPCPAAGIFESAQFPDSFLLPCYRSQSYYDPIGFLSIDSDSSYWGLLWNSQKLDDLQKKFLPNLFDREFGLQIQGLDEGLSSAQVEHTLSDIFRIKSGQNEVNIEVYSESSETELFNIGVGDWVSGNLGDDRIVNNRKEVRDIWFSSGSRKLNIFDTRPFHFQPSAEELVDIVSDSGYNLKWYNRGHESSNDNLDLTILSHLNNQSPALIKGNTSSVIFNGGVSRERIRFSTINEYQKLSFTESRVYSDCDENLANEIVGKSLIELIYQLENLVLKRGLGHLNSTPQLKFVYSQLRKADYCAISSSVVDPSAFFSSNGENLLWDYELPSYSKKHSSQSGFYLLAKRSEMILSAVKKSLQTIPEIKNIQNETITNILKEISGRGIPTLKTLASGGASANGELGMLTAMHLLQNFEEEDESFEFFPIKHENRINLLIPVDPFLSQINALYDRLKIERQRPDLIALSFCRNKGEVERIKITPIEIKYRDKQMDNSQLRKALFQCQNFKNFYNKLEEFSSRSQLWDIARCRLLTDMITFSFATYGRRIKNQQEKIEWAVIQSKLIRAINHQEKIEIDKNGRLIVVSNWKVTEFDRICSDEIEDVLKVSFKDAKDLLLREDLEKFFQLGKLGDWGLMCGCTEVDEKVINRKEIKKSEVELEDDNRILNNLNQQTEEKEIFRATTEVSQEQPPIDGGDSPDKTSMIETPLRDLGLQENSNSDSEVDGIKFLVGSHEGVFNSVDYYFHPSNTNLNQLNIGIVGDLGTGKTQLIKALVFNISRYPELNRGTSPKFLIMDTKRDYDGSGNKQSDQNFVRSINAKIVRPFKLPINLFDIRNSKDGHPALMKAEFLIDILRKIFGGIGPNQEYTLRTAVIKSFENRGYEPYRENYEDFMAPTLSNVFETYEEVIGNKKDAPFSIMHQLTLGKYFEEDPEKTLDFKDFFNQSVVLSLGGIASNDRNLKMVMIIFLNLYREYMLGVQKNEYRNTKNYQLRKIDSYLLIDEANLIMEYELPVLEDILLKGREFGVGVILSSQYLSHFRKTNTNYLEPLLTWFIHKVPNVSVKDLTALGLNNIDEALIKKVKSFQCHYCLYKSLDAPGEVIKGIPHYILDREQN